MYNEINSGRLDQASHKYFIDKKISLNKYVQGFSLASALGHSPKIVSDVQEVACPR